MLRGRIGGGVGGRSTVSRGGLATVRHSDNYRLTLMAGATSAGVDRADVAREADRVTLSRPAERTRERRMNAALIRSELGPAMRLDESERSVRWTVEKSQRRRSSRAYGKILSPFRRSRRRRVDHIEQSRANFVTSTSGCLFSSSCPSPWTALALGGCRTRLREPARPT